MRRDEARLSEPTIVGISPFARGRSRAAEEFGRAALELSTLPRPPVQKANMLSFNRDDDGVVHVSQLLQLEKHGTITMRDAWGRREAAAGDAQPPPR